MEDSLPACPGSASEVLCRNRWDGPRKTRKFAKTEQAFRAFCVFRGPHSSGNWGFLKCTHEVKNLPLSRCGLDFGRKGKKPNAALDPEFSKHYIRCSSLNQTTRYCGFPAKKCLWLRPRENREPGAGRGAFSRCATDEIPGGSAAVTRDESPTDATAGTSRTEIRTQR